MKKLIVIGGGTFNYVRNHLALAAPAFGRTARRLEEICKERFKDMEVELHLTKMADPTSLLVTNDDLRDLVVKLKEDMSTKVIFFNAAVCDYKGLVDWIPSSKHSNRLKTSEGVKEMQLLPSDKIIADIRKGRKDIFVIGFKTTTDATEKEQYLAGLDMMKRSSCNLVLANDTINYKNMIITPEEAKYSVSYDRDKVLTELVDMSFYRSHLTFTKSTVVEGHPVPWESTEVFPSLREVVNFCIDNNAYKPFNGATVGHFACKISPTEFLTSIRKSNFNDLKEKGLVRIKTDGPDSVIAYGAKPSVGGQSQRIIFTDHPDYDCIVHFHCPIKEGSEVPVISQREYECGSHQCGRNTSNGLKKFGDLSAVMLDNHGPNIVFHHSIDPQKVISFIKENFYLQLKTGGPVN